MFFCITESKSLFVDDMEESGQWVCTVVILCFGVIRIGTGRIGQIQTVICVIK